MLIYKCFVNEIKILNIYKYPLFFFFFFFFFFYLYIYVINKILFYPILLIMGYFNNFNLSITFRNKKKKHSKP